MKVENAMAIRTAIEKERADCMVKLDNELKLAKEVVEEKNREIEMYRVRTAALIEQGKRYKNMIDRLIEEFGWKSEIRQTIKEKVLYHVIYVKCNLNKVLKNMGKYNICILFTKKYDKKYLLICTQQIRNPCPVTGQYWIFILFMEKSIYIQTLHKLYLDTQINLQYLLLSLVVLA